MPPHTLASVSIVAFVAVQWSSATDRVAGTVASASLTGPRTAVCSTAATAGSRAGAIFFSLFATGFFLRGIFGLVEAARDFVEPRVWNLVGAVHDTSQD